MEEPRWRATFSSLRTRNYRIYTYGQVVSMAGTFMQGVAQAWLVVKLTGSGAALGWAVTLQFLPVLLLGAAAGVLVDRADRPRLYAVTQAVAGVQAVALGTLVATGAVRLWMVYAAAAILGLVNAVDQPCRQALTYDLVGPAQVPNAVSLTMAINHTSKVVGPAAGGLVIGAVGIAPCFFVNAVSFVGVIVALLLLRRDEMTPAPPQPRTKRQLREGLAYVRRTPELSGTLVMVAVMFGLGWQWDVLLPLLAKFAFDGDAGDFGLMSAALGFGSLVGALAMAGRPRTDERMILSTLVAIVVTTAAAAVVPWYALELVVLVAVGAAGILFAACCSATLQVRSDAAMRGRVMALYIIAVQGNRPISGPIAGSLAEHLGVRWCIALSAGALLAVGVPAWAFLVRGRTATSPPRVPALASAVSAAGGE